MIFNKKIKLPEEDYLFACGRINVRTGNIPNMQKLHKIAEARSLEEAIKAVEECKIKLIYNTESTPPSLDLQATFDNLLKEAYDVVYESVPTPKLYDILKYRYDCHNIKTCIKTEFLKRKIEAGLFDTGTLSKEEARRAVKERDFSALPENMSKAAEEAIESYIKTEDPQQIDIILDKACYLDMLNEAAKYNDPFFTDVIKTKIDLTNIMIIIRLLKMKGRHINEEYIINSIIPEGEIGSDFVTKVYEEELRGVSKALQGEKYGKYRQIATCLENDAPLAELEKVCDNIFIRKVSEAKSDFFGAAVPLGYIIGWEYAVMNLRIILASKEAGVSSAAIKERLRDSYV